MLINTPLGTVSIRRLFAVGFGALMVGTLIAGLADWAGIWFWHAYGFACLGYFCGTVSKPIISFESQA